MQAGLRRQPTRYRQRRLCRQIRKANVDEFWTDLKVKTGKSCLYVKRLSDVDLKVLEALIVDSVKRTKQRLDAR